MKIFGFVFALSLLILSMSLFPSTAYAHETIFVNSNASSVETSIEINVDSPKAIFDELPSGKYLRFYKIQLNQDESIRISLLVPKIIGQEDYNPAIVVMSDYVAQTFPRVPVSLVGTEEFLIVEYDNDIKNIFEEKFTGTNYYVHQSFNITSTKESDYFLTVFDRETNGGKYVLSVGDYDNSKLLEINSPYTLLQIKMWYGDYAIIVAATIAIGVSLLTIFWLTKMKGKLKWKKSKSRQRKKSKG